jgi:concanavalin A-like lectin/glucanase superfamily protein
MTGLAVLACLAVAAPSTAATPAATTPQTVLDLEMNEAPGATVAVDSSGLGHDGAIGSHLVMHNGYITWDRHSPDSTIYYGANHLVMVDDAADGSLDPGTGDFSVEFRFRSTAKFGNVIQKGQAKTTGGQVKFQQPKGYMSCMFKSPSGTAAIKSSIFTSDGAWHTIRCDRTPTEVDLYVDGVFNKRIRHTTGNIDNVKPWTIGGKFDCDTSNPDTGADSCDYWAGDMDYVHITKG